MNRFSLYSIVVLLQVATCVSIDDVFVRRVGKHQREKMDGISIGSSGRPTVPKGKSEALHTHGIRRQVKTPRSEKLENAVRVGDAANKHGWQQSVPESDIIYAQKAHELADELESSDDGTESNDLLEKRNQRLEKYGQQKESALVSDLICEGMPESHVAILLSGVCRSFKLPVFHHSLKVNVVDALGSNARVFAAITASSNDVAACQRAVDVLRPVSQSPMEIETPQERNPGCRTAMNASMLKSFLNQYWKVNLAFTAMEKYETTERIRFNWVLRVRPDLIYPRSLPPVCFFDDRLGKLYHDRADFMMLVPRPAAGMILNAWNEYQHCNDTLPLVNDPEHWLVHYAHKAGFDMACNGPDNCTNNFVVHNLFAGILARDYICCKFTLKGSDAMKWCDTFKNIRKTKKEDRTWQQRVFDSSLIEQEAARSDIAALPSPNGEESDME